MTDVIAHDHLAITAAAAQRDEVFAHIVAGVRAGGLPVPTQVTFEPFGPGYAYVCLHLDDGDVLGVDRWAAGRLRRDPCRACRRGRNGNSRPPPRPHPLPRRHRQPRPSRPPERTPG